MSNSNTEGKWDHSTSRVGQINKTALPEVTLHRIESKKTDAGAHYTIFGCPEARGMDLLRLVFPEGEANEMNFVLFSTSGIHGTYGLIEDCEPTVADDERGADVTFLIVHPRMVCLKYGVCEPATPEDFAFLKKLRASSWEAASQIGKPASSTGADALVQKLAEALTQARTAFASIANGIPAHERYAHKCALSMDDALSAIPKEPQQ